ncbi:MAG: alpha-hydroxy-acid oxidizing protein [Planctomycetes bacterium]|nr:alpha-hydroxy-acid oxidizing protein [Planctomycetota bacterium]
MPTPKLQSLLTTADFYRAARKALTPTTWDYFNAGADAQTTLRANRMAFNRLRLLPRVLVDVSKVDTSAYLFGEKLDWPVLIAPMAYQKLAHKDGEVAVAKAAAAAGTPYVVSTLATTTLEDTAQAVAEASRWFQLYVHQDRRVTQALVHRAQNAGYRALVVTVDAPMLGRRIADVRNRFGLPRGLSMVNLEPYHRADLTSAAGSALEELFASRHDATLNWNDLNWLRSLTKLPILLKGILRADDAKRAVEAGVQGIIVSNHGGRQLDGAIATLDALPAIVEAVYRRVPVLVDGGVRWGSDILKALALGANAVLVGRPVLWGLAVGGEAGVARVLAILREEFSRAMALCGCAGVASITRDLVA